MNIWLITVGEPLPIDGPNARLLRAGILSERLGGHGHQVTWWTSTFDHFAKKQRFDRDTDLTLSSGVRLKLLHGPTYRRNVSFQRIANHRVLGKKFEKAARGEP